MILIYKAEDSLAQLHNFCSQLGNDYGKAYRGILFRKRYGSIDEDVRSLSMRLGAEMSTSKSEIVARWPTGESLIIATQPRDVYEAEQYHDHAYSWMGWDADGSQDDESKEAYVLMLGSVKSTAPGLGRTVVIRRQSRHTSLVLAQPSHVV